ncbi:putative leader peptide [Streptomyces sp. NPDC055092]
MSGHLRRTAALTPPLVASLFTLRRHIDLARVSSATCR